MDMPTAIEAVIEGRDLSTGEMRDVMQLIMTGQATDAQIGGFLVGLRLKGESVGEIVAAASVMRELATPVKAKAEHLLDTCGTGGSGSSKFNVSTAAAFVAAAAGARVAKHGNRRASGKSGSADLLEAAGVKLDLSPEQVGRCIDTVGVGFLFALNHHSAMKHAIGPRREMVTRTIFNLLGPLTNPAGAKRQVVGVFDARWVRPIAEVLQQLGSEHVIVVHSEDGLDEISNCAETLVAELKEGAIREYRLTPEQFGVARVELDELRVGSPEESLEMVRSALVGEPGPATGIVELNAGAAIYVAGLSDSLESGVEMARDAIGGGLAAQKLKDLADFTSQLVSQTGA